MIQSIPPLSAAPHGANNLAVQVECTRGHPTITALPCFIPFTVSVAKHTHTIPKYLVHFCIIQLYFVCVYMNICCNTSVCTLPTPTEGYKVVLAGGLAGCGFWAVAYPLDSVKSRIQVCGTINAQLHPLFSDVHVLCVGAGALRQSLYAYTFQ